MSRVVVQGYDKGSRVDEQRCRVEHSIMGTALEVKNQETLHDERIIAVRGVNQRDVTDGTQIVLTLTEPLR